MKRFLLWLKAFPFRGEASLLPLRHLLAEQVVKAFTPSAAVNDFAASLQKEKECEDQQAFKFYKERNPHLFQDAPMRREQPAEMPKLIESRTYDEHS